MRIPWKSLSATVAVLALTLALAPTSCANSYFYRVVSWRWPDADDYLKFAERRLDPSARPFSFVPAPDEARVHAAFLASGQPGSLDAFLDQTGTQAFLVIRDDRLLYERYFHGAQRDTIVTSFSVAKSFASALVGKALEEGYIHSLDDSITRYIPELAARDSRFTRITIRHLLTMCSGIRYVEGFFKDDARTYYKPDLRKLALHEMEITGAPGQTFHYNNYHPLLVGLLLERTTGRHVTEYLQEKIWTPLGMEYSGSWSLDSQRSGFEKMESGINARAIDFAKFGRLYLNGGRWNGVQVIPSGWVMESTQPDTSVNQASYYPRRGIFSDGTGYYKYFWWGMRRDIGYDFAAAGNLGQFIYVSPGKRLILVRHGLKYGASASVWLRTFHRMATAFESSPP